MTIDYDKFAARYARNRQVNDAVLTDLFATSRITNAARVLEVGCGTGNYIAAIAERVGCQCWAVEPSDNMRAAAQQKTRGHVTLVTAVAEEMAFPENFFDLIFSVDVIHHLSNRTAHFAHAQAQLRPSGYFCIVTDSEEIIRTREPLSRYFPETVEVELQRYPQVPLLKEELRDAGFTEIADRITELPYQVRDIRPYTEKVFSALHLISGDSFARGIARMQTDLASGFVQGVARYVHIWARKL